MFFKVCVFSLLSVAFARPDVAFLNKNNNNGYQYQNQNQGYEQNAPIGMQLELPNVQRPNNFYANFNNVQQQQSSSTDIQPQLIMQDALRVMAQDSYQAAYQHSGTPHASGYNFGPSTQVHKHVYVHMPPKDFELDDAVQPHVRHQSSSKQKHYKIVFIKAPELPAALPAIVAPPPANEEKTLIYVLHKKPNTHQDIVIPTPAPTPPSKPEVFFIKYKTQQTEAPVYGVPPANNADIEPRQPAAEYIPPTAAATVDDAVTLEITTVLPIGDSNNNQQLANIAGNEQTSSSHYLPPNDSSNNIITAGQVPDTRYGAPNKLFFKQ